MTPNRIRYKGRIYEAVKLQESVSGYEGVEKIMLDTIKQCSESELLGLVYAHPTNTIPHNGPTFIIKDGRYIDFDKSLGHIDTSDAIHLDFICELLNDVYYAKIAPTNPQYKNWTFYDWISNQCDIESDDVFADLIMDDVIVTLGWVKANSGNGWTDDRLYFVIPPDVTDKQMYSIRDFLEAFEDTKHDYQAYFLDNNANLRWHVQYSFWKTPDEFLNIMRRFINTGKKPYGESKKIARNFGQRRMDEAKADEFKFRQFVGDDLADQFYKLKPRMKSPQNDIYYWMKKDTDELKDFLNNLSATKTRKEKSDTARQGAEKLYSDDKWDVLKINTFEASKKYGKGTTWCITGKESGYVDDFDDSENYYWQRYRDDGVEFYFYIDKEDGYKYAVAVYPDGNHDIFDDTDELTSGIPDAPLVKEVGDVSPTDFATYSYDKSKLRKYYGVDRDVTIPPYITIIGTNAFEDSEVVEVNLNHVEMIQGYAFNGCNDLWRIAVGDELKKIEARAFPYCARLQQILYGGTLKQWEQIDIHPLAFTSRIGKDIVIHCIDGDTIVKRQ